MIFTNVDDNITVKTLNEKFQKCIQFFKENDLEKYEVGVHDIGVDGVKMNIGHYNTMSIEETKFETHLKKLDIQIMISGEEIIDFNYKKNVKEEKIDIENDIIFYSGEKMYSIPLKKGDAVIFYPEDAHKPGIKINESILVKKVVFKIDIDKM